MLYQIKLITVDWNPTGQRKVWSETISESRYGYQAAIEECERIISEDRPDIAYAYPILDTRPRHR